MYKVQVTIPTTGDYTLVVNNTSAGMDNHPFPVVVTNATIDDVKGVVDDLTTTLANVEAQVNTLDEATVNAIASQVQQVQTTVDNVKQLIQDTASSFVLSGDETGTISVGDTVTGDTSGAKGVVKSVTYDTTGNATTVELSSTQGAFQVGETVNNGTASTTGTISDVTLSPIDSVMEFVNQINNALTNGASSLDVLKTLTDDVENMLRGDTTLSDGSPSPFAGKGLVAIYDQAVQNGVDIGTANTALADATNGLAAIKTAVTTAETNIRADIAALTDSTNANSLVSKIDAAKQVIDSNAAALTDSTSGLAALRGVLDTLSSNIATHDTDIKAILNASDGGLADIKSVMVSRFDSVDSQLATINGKIDGIAGSQGFEVLV